MQATTDVVNPALTSVSKAWGLGRSIFFDLQARATSEIAVADLSDSENR